MNRKLVFSFLTILSISLTGNDVLKKENLMNDEVKSFLTGLNALDSTSVRIIKDYYTSKFCDEEIFKSLKVNEIKDFINYSKEYDLLIAQFTYKESNYMNTIKDFKKFNCGR